jgi:hypothetical protein
LVSVMLYKRERDVKQYTGQARHDDTVGTLDLGHQSMGSSRGH